MLSRRTCPRTDKPDTLEQQQLDLFKELRENKADRDARRAQLDALAAADPTRAPQPFYLGDKSQLIDTELSPNGRWMLVVTQPAHHDDGKAPNVIHYVTQSGYTEDQPSRSPARKPAGTGPSPDTCAARRTRYAVSAAEKGAPAGDALVFAGG